MKLSAVTAVSILMISLAIAMTGYAEVPIEVAPGSATPPARIEAGLQALYDFGSADGDVVKDRSGMGRAVDLRVENLDAVRRTSGALEIRAETKIRSIKAPVKIIESVRRSGEITIEAWVQPSNITQSGPARIVTLSQNSSNRNFTLGQDGSQYDVRFRTTTTNSNGSPSLSTENDRLTKKITHVVYTRDRLGQVRLFLDGKLDSEKKVAGGLSTWGRDYTFAIGNELSGGREWLGTYYLVAIYNRALTPGEIVQNHRAGHEVLARPQQGPSPAALKNAKLFRNKIAPLFVERCLECHDSSARKGGVDLSLRESTVADGENGAVIVPGDSANSSLIDAVEFDDMPKNQEPLTDEEKDLLAEWIDGGAVWATPRIDAADYVHRNVAGNNWVRRLTMPEYTASVRSVTGVDIEREARDILPEDLRADGFRNTAYNLQVDLKRVQAYARLSEMIVARMDLAAFTHQYGDTLRKQSEISDEALEKMGALILRGPLDDAEVASYRRIAESIGEATDTAGKTRSIVSAMLQSPRFIYRVENQLGDGSRWPVGAYELASRLSYLVWGAPPDKPLLEEAESGALLDEGAIARAVERMLADPRAVKRSTEFASEWLDLERLNSLRPNPKSFPEWDPELASQMHEETLAYFVEVVWKQQRPLSDLLNAQVTYARPRLARHYGFEVNGDGLKRYDLAADSTRGGLLTQASLLTVGGDEASMVTRGLFVLHDLLRGTINNPPADADTTPIAASAGQSRRSIAEGRVESVSCGGCHKRFEPLAFGLEKYDGLGVYHEQDEHGNDLSEHGEIQFPGEAEPVEFRTTVELMDLLAQSERVQETITWKLTQFAVGRPLGADDRPYVDEIHGKSQTAGGTYAALIAAIAVSDLVRTTRTEPYE
jgi:hypothetical protein